MEKWRGLYLVVVVAVAAMGAAEGQLRTDFYQFTCPNVEAIVQQVVSDKISQTFITIPATLRLFFHDCFVEGCDASIMIQSPNGDAEKDDHDNISLAGDAFDTVIKAKQAVEAQCPGVVSCADILTIAARDVVTGSGGPFWGVELGRRDGLISNAGRVSGNLPQPDSNLDLLNSMFRKNNLTQTDMVALSGAHTLGFSHCDRFANRIHSTIPDPSLDSDYALKLMQDCPVGVDPSIVIDLDPTTPRVFDNAYYTNLVEKKGLFSSDQVLFTNPASRGTVVQFASDNAAFTEAFVEAMVKLGRTAVKVGFEGEIRRDCTMFN